MLDVLLDVNYTTSDRFSKRIGLRKRILNIITESMMSIDRDAAQNIFSHGSFLEQELINLFVAYKKNYNLSKEVIIDICGRTLRVIEDICYIMNERVPYCSNMYNGFGRREFVDKVLEEAFKDGQ